MVIFVAGTFQHFPEITPDLKDYFNALRDILGQPEREIDGYELTPLG